MPAKRSIILNYDRRSQMLRCVLWADVPAGNQLAYANPSASSSVVTATEAELQAIRSGQVVERALDYSPASGLYNAAAAQTWLDEQWAAFQSEVTGETPWVDYGRHSNNTGVWQSATGVPMASTPETFEGLPGYVMVTPVSAFAANKCHFMLWNNAPAATSQKQRIQIRFLAFLPHSAAVTGVASGPWSLQRRTGGTNPSGGTTVTAARMDSAQVAPAGISAGNNQTVGTGGTLETFATFIPPADEAKPATLDSPTFASIQRFGGMPIWENLPGVRPLTLRPGQTLEVVQDATAGTGNGRILCIATVG